jgi:electron transfer flavoprotein beta subunit
LGLLTGWGVGGLRRQAKKKKIDVLKAEDLGVDIKPRNTVVSVAEPSTRKAGVLVDTVDDLVNKLKNEAKVI